MEYIELKNTGKRISRLGFGCCPMGGHGWGETQEQDLVDAVHAALDNGVNFFDTADIYGLGESERVLGKALESRRDEAFIATKFGVRMAGGGRTYYDNSPGWLREALSASLRRLDTDHIDLYQVHYRDGKTPPAAIIESLEKERDAGRIRYYGLTNIDPGAWDMSAAPDGMMSFSYEYSLANREHEREIERIQDVYDLVFLSWGSLGQGILTGKYGRNSVFSDDDRRRRGEYRNFHGAGLEKNIRIVNKVRKLEREYGGRSSTQIAIRWILDRLPGSIALTGIKTPLQLRENAGALGWTMAREHMIELEQET